MKQMFKSLCEGRSSKTGCTAALVLALSAGAAFADPVALVLDRSEGVDVTAFSELMPGDVVDLGEGGHVDLLDYGACQEVRLTSGTLSMAADSYSLDGGAEEVLRAGNCLQAHSGSDEEQADKGLTVTLRGLTLETKKAASLMLRFDDALRNEYDTVFVSFEGGAPKRFDVLDNILTEMPNRDTENEAVEVELFLQGKAPDYGVVMRKFTIDPAKVGRNTAVVIVK